MADKITHKIAALPPDADYFSLEFFPPKTQAVWPSFAPSGLCPSLPPSASALY